MLKFNIGQKIYYRGDMANNSGWFEITEIIEDDYFRGCVLKLKKLHEEKYLLEDDEDLEEESLD